MGVRDGFEGTAQHVGRCPLADISHHDLTDILPGPRQAGGFRAAHPLLKLLLMRALRPFPVT